MGGSRFPVPYSPPEAALRGTMIGGGLTPVNGGSAHHRLLALLFASFLVAASSVASLAALEQEVKSEAEVIAAYLNEAGAGVVAVSDFSDLGGNVTDVGRFMAEEFSIALAEFASGFKVVDRSHLKALLQQHELNSSGLIDPGTVRLIGRFSGVDVLVTGTIVSFDETLRLEIKVLELESAIVMKSSVIEVRNVSTPESCCPPTASGRGATEEETPDRGTQAGDSPGFVPPGYELLLSCHFDGDTALCTLSVTDSENARSRLVQCRAIVPPADTELSEPTQ